MKRVGWEIKNVFNEEEWRLNMECRSCISITCCCLSGDLVGVRSEVEVND